VGKTLIKPTFKKKLSRKINLSTSSTSKPKPKGVPSNLDFFFPNPFPLKVVQSI
jgi:hypothetical protein